MRYHPFQELYVTETIGPDRFISLFSPFLVKHAPALFQPGNIFIKGVQGSGKSMLLRLLHPETRIAYEKAGKILPIKKESSRFISAGVNLTKCGAIDFGQLPIANGKEGEEIKVLPLYFGDFINYLVVIDLLKCLEILTSELDGKIAAELGISNSKQKMDDFAKSLSQDDCWFGYLNGISDIDILKNRMTERVSSYRAFLNLNMSKLPDEINNSKTSIGVPISQTVKYLRDNAVIPNDLTVFIKIDQYEELTRLESIKSDLGPLYQQVIHKAIGMRDAQVSYRVGTRRYALKDDLPIYGTNSKLEEERNYKVIDIDEILRRTESSRTWIFPDFAEDVFARRISQTDFRDSLKKESLLRKVFGPSPHAADVAKDYAGRSPRRGVRTESNWPQNWIDFLNNLADVDPLQARLAEAWCRQDSKEKREVMYKIPSERPYPWEKPYWKKERVEQALMQIAGRCGARMTWAGTHDILALSGTNILVFLSMCQHIWNVWVRDNRGLNYSQAYLPKIEPDIQTLGIQEASSHWFDKISSEAGGKRHQRFIRYVGTMFYKKMSEDKAMSYPGNNGFSLKISELNSKEVVRSFLADAVDYGNLYDSPHTTKTKDREQRRKWYLNPILCPLFKIPVARTKEPMYVSDKDVAEWINISYSSDSATYDSTDKAEKNKEDNRQLPLI